MRGNGGSNVPCTVVFKACTRAHPLKPCVIPTSGAYLGKVGTLCRRRLPWLQIL